MAKIVSPVWSSARGSIAGTTYLTTPSGQIIARQRTRPVNTTTLARSYVKNSMIIWTAGWNAITQVQRSDWDIYAQANGLGSGRQAFLAGLMFTEFVLETGLAGVAVINQSNIAPLTNFAPSVAMSIGIRAGAGTDGIAITLKNTGPQRIVFYIDVSPGLSPARNFWRGPWDYTKSLADVLLSGATVTKQVTGLHLGQRYFYRLRTCTNDTTAPLAGLRLASPLIQNQLATHVA